MKKVLFFTQNRWAFGSIHHSLIKELYKNNIYSNLLDWDVLYTLEEFELLIDKYDLFVTNPDAVINLHSYGVPFEKIIVIAHGQWDILLSKNRGDFNFYPYIKSFAVISNILKRKCKEWEMSVEPSVVEFGVHFDMYYQKPSTSLNKVGYTGAISTANYFGEEIKRGHLVQNVVNNINKLELIQHQNYNHLCMPSFYKKVDCVIMSSIEEAGGLPMIECAAAGRLPMGTPVGYFEENAPFGAGELLPIQEDMFVEKATEKLIYYINNDEDYTKKCKQVQEYARENYDWSKKIESWINLFEN